MRMLYFIADARGQLLRVPREVVENLWRGRARTPSLEFDVGEELRIITALIETETLLPQVCFFLRLSIEDGSITDESKLDAYEALTEHKGRRYDSPEAQRQFAGWPGDWPTQMAVALDVPVARLRKVGLGGPLVMSDLWGVPIDRIVDYFAEACDER